MNKNDTLHILFTSLNGCLPYEYDEKFTNNETTIILTKAGSDHTMYISPDEYNSNDLVAAVTHNDPTQNHHEEYETLYWTSDDEQIPLDTILAEIQYYL